MIQIILYLIYYLKQCLAIMAFHFNVSKELQTAQAFTKQKGDFSEDKEWRVDLGSDLSCLVDDLMGGLLSCHLFWQQQIILILSPIFSPRSHTHTYKYEFGVQIQSGKCVTRRVKNGPFLASKTHQSNTSTWPTTTSTTIPPLQIQIQNWNSNTISKSLLKVFNLSYKLRSTHKKQFFFFPYSKRLSEMAKSSKDNKNKATNSQSNSTLHPPYFEVP